MGRSRQAEPPVPASFYREAFEIHGRSLVGAIRPKAHFRCRPDDWSRWNAQHAGQPVGFLGPAGVMLVRFQYLGKTRRATTLRVAWIVHSGELPRGIVKARDDDQANLAYDNLLVVKRGHNPFSAGTSSLKRRSKTGAALLATLAANPGATVPMLSKLIGSSVSCCCTKLGKLADSGFCARPRCDARARWDLTAQGRELATSGQPVVDHRDRDILRALARAPAGVVGVARMIGVCDLTARRRIDLLIERSLVAATEKRFVVTDQGRALIGAAATHPRWLKVKRNLPAGRPGALPWPKARQCQRAFRPPTP